MSGRWVGRVPGLTRVQIAADQSTVQSASQCPLAAGFY